MGDLNIYALLEPIAQIGLLSPIQVSSSRRLRQWKKAQKIAWDVTEFHLKSLDRKETFELISHSLEERNNVAHSMSLGATEDGQEALARRFDKKNHKKFIDVTYTRDRLVKISDDIRVHRVMLIDDSTQFKNHLEQLLKA
ncbi:MAG: hypothetical protein ABJ242_12835 [Marinomonas sp.]